MFCDNLEGWDGMGCEGDGRGLRKEGVYVYLWLIHTDVRQRPTLKQLSSNNCILFYFLILYTYNL